MAEFSVIDASKAPAAPKAVGRSVARQQEYDSYVLGVKKGQVGRLNPGSGETARGVALRIARAAKRNNRAVETWVVDGAVYFRIG